MKEIHLLAILAILIFASCTEKLPRVVTAEAMDVTVNSALVGGQVLDEGSEPVFSTGICWSNDYANPDISVNKLEAGRDLTFNLLMTDLDPFKHYYVRAYATSLVGTAYGQSVSFDTSGNYPQATTLIADDITDNAATLYGLVQPSLLATEAYFEYRLKGETQFTSLPVPGTFTGGDTIRVSLRISNLKATSDYEYRLKAFNSIGDRTGELKEFRTYYETVTDIDGNIYRILQIGQQTWMIDNLQVSRLRDGQVIPNKTSVEDWGGSNTVPEPAMCWYDNDKQKYAKTYGALYNWYAASHPLIAPEGWRVATIDDYEKINEYLGGVEVAGGKMKTTGYDLWHEPNEGATNSSGFSAVPGGARLYKDYSPNGFYGLRIYAHYWTQSKNQNFDNWPRGIAVGMSFSTQTLGGFEPFPARGYSIRCIKI